MTYAQFSVGRYGAESPAIMRLVNTAIAAVDGGEKAELAAPPTSIWQP